RRVSLVRDLYHVELLVQLQTARGKHTCAVASRIAKLARIGACVFKKLTHRLHRQGRIDVDEKFKCSDERDWREIAERNVRRALAHRRHSAKCRARGVEQRIAVRW